MSNEAQVKELLLVWEELRDQGQSISAQELCERHGCPELANALVAAILALESLDARLDTSWRAARTPQPHVSTSTPAGPGDAFPPFAGGLRGGCWRSRSSYAPAGQPATWN